MSQTANSPGARRPAARTISAVHMPKKACSLGRFDPRSCTARQLRWAMRRQSGTSAKTSAGKAGSDHRARFGARASTLSDFSISRCCDHFAMNCFCRSPAPGAMLVADRASSSPVRLASEETRWPVALMMIADSRRSRS